MTTINFQYIYHIAFHNFAGTKRMADSKRLTWVLNWGKYLYELQSEFVNCLNIWYRAKWGIPIAMCY